MIHIRLATIEDLSSVLEILNYEIEYKTNVYHYKTKTLQELETWFLDKQQHNFPVFVAEKDNAIVGYATYGSFRPWQGFYKTVEHSLYVKEGFAGNGIGRQLLQHLIATAKTQALHIMVAGIDAKNTGSIAFHKKFGFLETGRMPQVGYKFNEWLDLVFMQLQLDHNV